MEELIKKMIASLRKQVLANVPEAGEFPMVYEREENPDKTVALSHLILKVTAVDLKGDEDKRLLELAVLNYPCPYGAEMAVCYGTTKEILVKLDEDELVERLLKLVHRLERDLEDV